MLRTCRDGGVENDPACFSVATKSPCNACKAKRCITWYEANKDRHKANMAAWRAANPERKKSLAKASYIANRERANKRSQDWYDANKARAKASMKAWLEKNPEWYRAIQHNARARRRSAHGIITKQDVLILKEMSLGLCAYCFKTGQELSIEHVTALAAGGENYLDNLVMACRSCNSRKGARGVLSMLPTL